MADVSKAPGSVKHPARDEDAEHAKRENFDEVMYQRNLFMSMALDMTWQLALVVIAPIVGGYVLDQHYHKAPWLTLAGFAVAAVGVFAVLSRIVAQASNRSGYGRQKERL